MVVDLERIEADQLPLELAVSAITMAELAAGPHATGDADKRAAGRTDYNGRKRRSILFPSTERRLALRANLRRRIGEGT